MSCGNIHKIRKRKLGKKKNAPAPKGKTCGTCELGRWYCNYSKETPACQNWVPILKPGDQKREDPERKEKIRKVVFGNASNN